MMFLKTLIASIALLSAGSVMAASPVYRAAAQEDGRTCMMIGGSTTELKVLSQHSVQVRYVADPRVSGYQTCRSGVYVIAR